MTRMLNLIGMVFGVTLFFSSFAHAELFPSEGPPGTTVTISGEAFGDFQSTQNNRVEFQGVPALIQSWKSDFILVKVPLNARSGPVMVISGSTQQEAGIFSVKNPHISSVAPLQAEAGSLLTIVGEQFGNTAGSRDPNTMFGVNQVLINGIRAEVHRWRPTKIEVLIPANAKTGDVQVRLASSDPLPDGSCCAPVEYAVSNSVPLQVIPAISFDPSAGPIGSKVVFSGQDFGEERPEDGRILFNGKPAVIAKWSDRTIVAHVPLNAQSGPLTLHRDGKDRDIGAFTLLDSQISGMSPSQGPIGTLVIIKGKNFGVYSESGSTAYAFDFLPGGNGVEIGGVPAVIHRWLDDQIDVWVPFSAKSGPVVVKRGGVIAQDDGTCCAKKEIVSLKAGDFTVTQPEIHSYSPKEAGLDELVTITGTGFGEFLKISEATRSSIHQDAHSWQNYILGEDVSRSEVLLNGVATQVVSWTDKEITIRVPRRPAFGFGNPTGFDVDLTEGKLILKRGSWDILENGECCTPKKYITVVGGPFKILQRGLPDQDYWNQKERR